MRESEQGTGVVLRCVFNAYTGEISTEVMQRTRCRGGSQHHSHWPTLDWGRDFSETFPPPLTEAAIFESPKFSKVLRTAFIISCQCCSLLYASSYHFPPEFMLSLTVRKKIRSFQQGGNKKLLFHNLSSWGQEYSGHCQGIYIYFSVSDETASESTASSPVWHYPVYHR